MTLLKKEQKVILALLSELDEICRKEKIEYYLSPRLADCAVKGEPFPSDPLCGEVLMKVREMERFRLAAEDRLSTGRALESMKSHKWFPGFYLRYEDTHTLCLDLDAGRDYEVPSLGINIYPLRTEIPEGTIRRRNIREESGWEQLCGSYKGTREGAFGAKMAVKLRCMAGQEQLGNKLYDDFCRRQQNPDADAYIWRKDGMNVIFPGRMFRGASGITLEGEMFPVPFDIEGYLKIGGVESPGEKPNLVVSAVMSWEEFRKNSESLEKLLAERVHMKRRWANADKRNAAFVERWEYDCLCQERKELGAYYIKKKDYIRNLHKNGDFLKLEKVFKPYSKMMQRCLLQEEVFMEDEEIFDIYMDVLQKTGKAVQKSKIKELI